MNTQPSTMPQTITNPWDAVDTDLGSLSSKCGAPAEGGGFSWDDCETAVDTLVVDVMAAKGTPNTPAKGSASDKIWKLYQKDTPAVKEGCMKDKYARDACMKAVETLVSDALDAQSVVSKSQVCTALQSTLTPENIKRYADKLQRGMDIADAVVAGAKCANIKSKPSDVLTNAACSPGQIVHTKGPELMIVVIVALVLVLIVGIGAFCMGKAHGLKPTDGALANINPEMVR